MEVTSTIISEEMAMNEIKITQQSKWNIFIENNNILPLTRVMSLTDKKNLEAKYIQVVKEEERNKCKRSCSDSHLLKNLHIKKSIELSSQLKRLREKSQEGTRRLSNYGKASLEEFKNGKLALAKKYSNSKGHNYLVNYMKNQEERIFSFEKTLKEEKSELNLVTENIVKEQHTELCDITENATNTYLINGKQVAVVRPMKRQQNVEEDESELYKNEKHENSCEVKHLNNLDDNNTYIKDNKLNDCSVQQITREDNSGNKLPLVAQVKYRKTEKIEKKKINKTASAIESIGISKLWNGLNNSAFKNLADNKRNSLVLQPKFCLFDC